MLVATASSLCYRLHNFRIHDQTLLDLNVIAYELKET